MSDNPYEAPRSARKSSKQPVQHTSADFWLALSFLSFWIGFGSSRDFKWIGLIAFGVAAYTGYRGVVSANWSHRLLIVVGSGVAAAFWIVVQWL